MLALQLFFLTFIWLTESRLLPCYPYIHLRCPRSVVCPYPNVTVEVRDESSLCPIQFFCASNMDECIQKGCEECNNTIYNGGNCRYDCISPSHGPVCRIAVPVCAKDQVLQTITIGVFDFCPQYACYSIDECVKTGCDACKKYIQKGKRCSYTCTSQNIIIDDPAPELPVKA